MEYHGFCRWYWSRVVPSILTGSKEIIIAEYRGQITGVAILKNEAGEKKICTLRVRRGFQNQGTGRKMMELAFARLNTQKPFITVSSSRIAQFKKIFSYYGFQPSALYGNYYHSGRAEICFNGSLPGEQYHPQYAQAAGIQIPEGIGLSC